MVVRRQARPKRASSRTASASCWRWRQWTALPRLQPELQLEALLAFCRGNLHDPDLLSQQAADHAGISIRTLHLRCQQIGQTFGRWVLESRLEACGNALCDPNNDG
jgi:AraC-like DNA-binding protein